LKDSRFDEGERERRNTSLQTILYCCGYRGRSIGTPLQGHANEFENGPQKLPVVTVEEHRQRRIKEQKRVSIQKTNKSSLERREAQEKSDPLSINLPLVMRGAGAFMLSISRIAWGIKIAGSGRNQTNRKLPRRREGVFIAVVTEK
jgi:hypothetical protein